jgi:hypothetical protein
MVAYALNSKGYVPRIEVEATWPKGLEVDRIWIESTGEGPKLEGNGQVTYQRSASYNLEAYAQRPTVCSAVGGGGTHLRKAFSILLPEKIEGNKIQDQSLNIHSFTRICVGTDTGGLFYSMPFAVGTVKHNNKHVQPLEGQKSFASNSHSIPPKSFVDSVEGLVRQPGDVGETLGTKAGDPRSPEEVRQKALAFLRKISPVANTGGVAEERKQEEKPQSLEERAARAARMASQAAENVVTETIGYPVGYPQAEINKVRADIKGVGSDQLTEFSKLGYGYVTVRRETGDETHVVAHLGWWEKLAQIPVGEGVWSLAANSSGPRILLSRNDQTLAAARLALGAKDFGLALLEERSGGKAASLVAGENLLDSWNEETDSDDGYERKTESGKGSGADDAEVPTLVGDSTRSDDELPGGGRGSLEFWRPPLSDEVSSNSGIPVVNGRSNDDDMRVPIPPNDGWRVGEMGDPFTTEDVLDLFRRPGSAWPDQTPPDGCLGTVTWVGPGGRDLFKEPKLLAFCKSALQICETLHTDTERSAFRLAAGLRSGILPRHTTSNFVVGAGVPALKELDATENPLGEPNFFWNDGKKIASTYTEAVGREFRPDYRGTSGSPRTNFEERVAPGGRRVCVYTEQVPALQASDAFFPTYRKEDFLPKHQEFKSDERDYAPGDELLDLAGITVLDMPNASHPSPNCVRLKNSKTGGVRFTAYVKRGGVLVEYHQSYVPATRRQREFFRNSRSFYRRSPYECGNEEYFFTDSQLGYATNGPFYESPPTRKKSNGLRLMEVRDTRFGRGVFAIQKIDRGTELGKYGHVGNELFNKAEVPKRVQSKAAPERVEFMAKFQATNEIVDARDGEFVHWTGLFNHSNAPNAEVQKTGKIYAKRAIELGSEVFIDYSTVYLADSAKGKWGAWALDELLGHKGGPAQLWKDAAKSPKDDAKKELLHLAIFKKPDLMKKMRPRKK